MSVILIDVVFHGTNVIFEMLTHTYIIIGVDHRCEQRSVPLAVLQITEHFYINVDRSAIKISTHLYRDAQPEEFRHFNSFRYLLHRKHYT